MDNIIKNPGLQHLAEKVFWNLDSEDLKNCAQINQCCKKVLQYPIFCLRKFEHISIEKQKDWIKIIQSVTNSDKGIAIISYLQWKLKNEHLMDLLCYSSLTVQNDFRMKLIEICQKIELSDEDLEIVKILAALTDNPNAPNQWGDTPIYWAAHNGHTEIVKILAPLTDDPNAPDEDGCTPIDDAIRMGHSEIVDILALWTDHTENPVAPDELLYNVFFDIFFPIIGRFFLRKLY